MQPSYAFKLALQSLLKEKWINLLSTLTISAGLFIAGIGFFVFYNLDTALKRLPDKFSLVVYLDDNLSKDEIEQISGSLKSHSSVSLLKFISKDEALKELKSSLKNSPFILEGLEENPLPDSIELKLKKDAIGTESVKQLAEEISKIKGISEIDYGEKFLTVLHSLKTALKTWGVAVAGILSAGMIFVCYSTVKILFYRRNEEIATFKLLGATKGFIRSPFLIEGSVIGAGGGIISLACIFSFYYFLFARLSAAIPIFRNILLPADILLFLPFIGMFLGLSGAVIALGRLKY